MLPFYRAGKYLAEAIESILQQEGYQDWQLYLINDGSNEKDVRTARRYCAAYPETIHFLEHGNGQRCGISASRNLGIQHSGGDLIAFLDADDAWYSHKLKSQVAILDTYPEVQMVYGPALRWWSWNGGIDEHVPASVDGFGSDCVVPGSALLRTFLRDETLTPCIGSVVVRRAALDRVGGFEGQFWGLYDDQVFYAKVSKQANVFVSSDCVSRYRKHAESCCGQVETDVILSEGARFIAWLAEHFPNERHEAIELALSSR